MATETTTAAAEEPVGTPAAEEPVKEAPAAKKKTASKAKKPAKQTTVKIKLVKSLAGRLNAQTATAKSLGLRRIGDVTEQPDNAATRGKIARIVHLVEVTQG